MSTEAKLTSHLSISYSAAPTASGTTAAGSGTAAPSSTTTGASAKDMAGFLAALVDQLLAGAATADTTTTASGDDSPTSTAPTPFGGSVDPTALSVVQATVPRGNILIKQLTQGLQALQDQLDKGETPDPDLLKRLGELADTIAAMINVPTPATTPTANPETTLDPLAALGQSADKPKADPLVDVADTQSPAPGQSQTVPDSVAQFLASLGLQVPSTPSGGPAGTAADPSADQAIVATAPAQPLPAIAQLADKLAALTQSIAAASPDVAQKLEALAKKLDASETAPQSLAQLTVASDADGTELDKMVQALLTAKPATAAPATPALAAKTELPTPAPILRTEPQLETSAPPSGIVSGDPATAAAMKVATKPADATASDGASQPEAKVIAAATASVDTKRADSTDATGQQNAVPAAAPTAPPTAPRAIPAAYQAATSPINMGQVAFEMVRQVHQGTSRFSFRLDPPELGRVDVKMHVDASGTVSARLTVERSETLDMFQRDRGALEKALSQAGLDSGKTNLEFSLKQNQQNPFAGLTGGDQRPNNGGNPSSKFSLAGSSQDEDAISAVPSITLYRGIASAGGVNLFV